MQYLTFAFILALALAFILASILTLVLALILAMTLALALLRGHFVIDTRPSALPIRSPSSSPVANVGKVRIVLYSPNNYITMAHIEPAEDKSNYIFS